MHAQAALQGTTHRFRGNAAVLLKCPASAARRLPLRPPLEVTICELFDTPDHVDAIDCHYIVTVDDGPYAGMRLWVNETQLMERPK